VLLGVFRVSTLAAFLAGTALFLGAMYMLFLYRRIIFGRITREEVRAMFDLSAREKVVFAPLLLLVLWMGVYPESFLAPIRASVDPLVERVAAMQEQARARAGATNHVIPAEAGIHSSTVGTLDHWVPAFAGTTPGN
jgi:NADH-quinone oxidoreductase subunit M